MELLRCSVVLWSLLGLGGCQSSDVTAKNVAQGFKSNLDWVRDAFGEKVAVITNGAPDTPFPDSPADPRPEIRSLKQSNDLIASLNQDRAAADKITLTLSKSDPTLYLNMNGNKPITQPIALTYETITLADGVRDMNSFDPSRANSWFDLASFEFAEGSSKLPDGAEPSLRKAALLVKQKGTLRVVGYSASDRVRMEDGSKMLGLHEANLWLADLRARRVAEMLLAMGAPPRQMLVGAAPENSRAAADKVEIIIDY